MGTLLQSTFYGGATSGLFSTLTSAGAAGLSSTTLGLKLFYECSRIMIPYKFLAGITAAVTAIGTKIGFSLDSLAKNQDREFVNAKIEEMDRLRV